MAPEVRAAERDELELVLAIYNHYVRPSPPTFEIEPVPVEGRARWFADHQGHPAHRIVVHTDERDRVDGRATASPFRERAGYAPTVESSVYCRPDAVGRGVGSALYAHLFRALEVADVERVVAGVTLPNPASVALHVRFGFRRAGTFTRVGRKMGRYWDVLWMERDARPVASPDPS
ncbi:MAG: GNAT family N-acetyltransferase [Thermoplasmata archaeon]